MKRKYILPLALATTLAADAAGNAKAPKPAKGEHPNIIVIMCDDMGYGDLGCYGQPYISTPNIDSLARSGIRFTQAYAASPVSAPSRAGFMTGQHSGHCEVRGNKEYWRGVPTIKYGNNDEYSVVGQHPYDPGHIIIPEMLKDNGYTTGMFGKWAGGYEGSASTPDKRGIDEFFGYICQFQAHLYYPNFLNRYDPHQGDTATVRVTLEENIRYPQEGREYYRRPQYSADLIHRKAMEWIGKQRAGQPFFGMFTYTLPHAELVQPTDSIVARYVQQFEQDAPWRGDPGSRYNGVDRCHTQFAAMITRLDAYVGEIMQKLQAMGLLDNTLLIFTSDNGPHEEGGADPTFFGRDGKLKGLKRSCHEGGIRIPFIASWPRVIEGGQECDHQLAFYDVMPTFAELLDIKDVAARYRNPQKEVDYFDGISFAPTLTGNAKKQKKHDFLYWEFNETNQIGLRQGDWKLVVKRGTPELYNLADDLHEDHNLADEYPQRVKAMIEIVRREHTPSPYFSVTIP